MRIPCPHCGTRGHDEFAYYGDAAPVRPDASQPGAEQAFCDYVYLRDNPAGLHHELWYHAAGCRAWLVLERDVRTHRIVRADAARTREP